MHTLIALDIGTTGTKSAAVAEGGVILARGYAGYPTHHQPGNRVEQEPSAWWRATREAVAQLQWGAKLHSHELAGIALSGQMQDVVPVDATEAIGRAILYCDARAQPEANAISTEIGEDELRRVTGNIQDASSVLAKWRWLRTNEDARLAGAQTILLGAHSYVAWRLCGVPSCDYTTASTTGLLDLNENAWAADLLGQLGIDQRKLPPLTHAAAQIGTLAPAIARQLGLPPDVPVFAGAGDLAATTVGVGAAEPNRSYCYLGTSGWIGATPPTGTRRTNSDARRGIATLRHPDPRNLIRVAPMMTAGGNLDWARGHITQGDNHAALDAAAAAVPAGSNGVVYLPYLNGERSPFHDPHARACFVGIGARTTRADLVRAVMEGVCFAYRSLWESLRASSETVYVAGGGAESAVWMQMMADVLGRRIRVVAEPRSAALRGAAIIVGHAIGWYDTLAPRDAIPVLGSYEPLAPARTTYDARYEVFAELYPRLRPAFAALGAQH